MSKMTHRSERQPVFGEDLGQGQEQEGMRLTSAFRSCGLPTVASGFYPPASPQAGSPPALPPRALLYLGNVGAEERGSFMSLFNNPFIPHSAFISLVSTTSTKFINLDKDGTSDSTRTVERLLWKQNENVRLIQRMEMQKKKGIRRRCKGV